MRVSPHRGIAIVQLFPALHVRPCRGLADDCWQVQSRKKNLDCPSKTTESFPKLWKGKESWVEQACFFFVYANPRIHAGIPIYEYREAKALVSAIREPKDPCTNPGLRITRQVEQACLFCVVCESLKPCRSQGLTYGKTEPRQVEQTCLPFFC